MSASIVDRSSYRDALVAARRFARTDQDARDLLHDALEIAIQKGIDDWASPERRAWLRGVMRRRAAFIARGRARRERRERVANALSFDHASASAYCAWEPSFLASLPPSLRSLATLAGADLCATEIRWLLALTDTALRQRLSALRRALRACRDLPTLPAPEPVGTFGVRRAQVLSHLQRRGGRAIATQDPDGHVIFLRLDAHKSARAGKP